MITAGSRDTRAAVVAATATATVMIAYQMAAKATRDALFLSSFDVSALPAMIMVSAFVSVGLAFLTARAMTTVGPARLIPMVFAGSAILLLIEWVFLGSFRRPIAVIVYLHYGGLGALLVSGFWSIVNERFDPRTAKKQIGRIAAGATIGGLLGGVLAERVAVLLTVAAMFPILAALHLVCAWLVLGLRPKQRAAVERPESGEDGAGETGSRSGLRIIAETPYLRRLVALVLFATVSEMLIDYVFKARASETFGSGEDLLRLFGVFYTGVALLTVVVQATAIRFTLQRLGPGRTTAVLPAVLALGSAGALVAPGLVSAMIARGSEAVMRNSLYRPGYELLFAPLARKHKRATKTLVDVGVVRLGDVAGGALVQAILLIGATSALSMLLGFAVALSVAGVFVAVGLHRGYARTLEESLLRRGSQLDLDDIDAVTGTAMLHTIGTLNLEPFRGRDGVADDAAVGSENTSAKPVGVQQPETILDPGVQRIIDLKSRDVDRVRRALAKGRLTPELVSHTVLLLAWDQLVTEVIKALRTVAETETGQLVDRLLDRDEEFVVRRRIPLVLAASPTQRAVDGLFQGLEDLRFEVRYRCGRALSSLLDLNAKLVVDRERAVGVVLREVAVERGVWQSHRLLDQMEDEDYSPIVDEVLRDRANRSLEHVFTVLSLFLPREPLKVAFRGLHTDDAYLRGTALEYLETALPTRIKEQLWPALEDDRKNVKPTRPSDQILSELLESNESIIISLKELRRKSQG